MAGAKGKRLTDFMAGRLVQAVEALEAEEPKAASAWTEGKQQAAKLKAFFAQRKAFLEQPKGRKGK
jgi:hypothetical protein